MSIIQPADLPKILLHAPFSRAIKLTTERRVYNLKPIADGFACCVLAESPLPHSVSFVDMNHGIRFECDCPETEPCVHFWALLVRLFQDGLLRNPELQTVIRQAIETGIARSAAPKHHRTPATLSYEIDLFGEDSLPLAAGIPQSGRQPIAATTKALPAIPVPRNSLFLIRFQTSNRPDLWVETAALPGNARIEQPDSLPDEAAENRSNLEASIDHSPEKQLSLGAALEKLIRINPELICFATPGRRMAIKPITNLDIKAVFLHTTTAGHSAYQLHLEFQVQDSGTRITALPQTVATEGGLSYVFARTEDSLLYRMNDPTMAGLLTRIRHLPTALDALEVEKLRLWMEKNPVPDTQLFTNPDEQFQYRDSAPRAVLTLQGGLKRTELFLRFDYEGIDCAIHDDGETLSRVLRDKATLVVPRRRDLENAILTNLRAITVEMTQFESGLYANLVANRPVADISVVCELAEFVTRFGLAVLEAGIELRMEGHTIRSGGGLTFRAESDLDWFGFRAGWKPDAPATTADPINHALVVDDHLDRFGLAAATDPAGGTSWIMLGKRDVDRLKLLRKLGMDGNGIIETSPVNVTLIDSLYDQIENQDEIHIQRARDLVRTLGGFTSRHIAASHHDDTAAPAGLIEGLLPQPAGLRATLRNYQLLGFNWLAYLHTQNLGGCLADDMGLGKTVQTIALLQSLKERGELRPSLIIAPVVTLPNWEDELARFAPDLRIRRHAGTNRSATIQSLVAADSSPEPDGQPDLILVSYHTLRNDLDLFVQVQWDYVILDEAHYIKNAGSQIFKAIRVLPSRHRLSLTGTPIENSTMELWSQFSFLNPGLLGSRKRFQNDVASPIEREGSEEALGALRDTISPFILRRRKEDVLADLPPKDEILHWCEMAPDQARLYEEHRSLYRDQIAGILNDKGVEKSGMDIFRCLLRLRQIAINPAMISRKPLEQSGDTESDSEIGSPYSHISSTKMESLRMILDESLQEDHKTLVFSQFVTALKLISRDLIKTGTRHALLTGATVDRRTAVSQFQTDPDLHLFLLSLKAGGVGINLTSADYVVLFDPWWNPAAERQAVDRAHRIGQKRPVLVYKLITRGTIEEKILALQAKKHILAGNLIDGGETGFFHGMNQDEVLDLFGK